MTPAAARPAEVLDSLVASGREAGGAVAVVRGDVVDIDHVAGACDGVQRCISDTLVMTFSVAKPVAAIADVRVL